MRVVPCTPLYEDSSIGSWCTPLGVECQAQSAAHKGLPRTGYRRVMGGPVCR